MYNAIKSVDTEGMDALPLFSGGASAVKEPVHFEVIKSSNQVTRMHFFLKKVDDLFLVVALETQAANAVSPSK